jgi:hypothetical protein
MSGFSSSVNFSYSRGIKSMNEADIANLYGNSVQNNRIRKFDKNNIKSNPILQKIYNTKIMALLNFNDTTYDVPIKKTIEYYIENVPMFYDFPIIDTKGDKNMLIDLLNQYYNEGYRYFYGFTISPELNYVLDWFNKHPDAQGISNQSLAPSLAIPKTVFRMLNSEITNIQFEQMIEGCDSVYFIYNINNQTFVSWNNLLSSMCEVYNINYISYSISNTTNLSTQINNIITNINNNVVSNSFEQISILNSLAEWQDQYFNSFTSETQIINNTIYYTITNSLPAITNNDSKAYFNNILKIIVNTANLNSSPLWRQGLNNLNSQFNYATLNAMSILYKLDKSDGFVYEIANHSDSQIFDLVTRDNLSNSWSIQLYLGDAYKNIIIYYVNNKNELFEALLPE